MSSSVGVQTSASVSPTQIFVWPSSCKVGTQNSRSFSGKKVAWNTPMPSFATVLSPASLGLKINPLQGFRVCCLSLLDRIFGVFHLVAKFGPIRVIGGSFEESVRGDSDQDKLILRLVVSFGWGTRCLWAYAISNLRFEPPPTPLVKWVGPASSLPPSIGGYGSPQSHRIQHCPHHPPK